MNDYNEMEYEELKALHTDIGQLLKDKKEEALEKIRGQMENLGFTTSDLVPKPTKGNGKGHGAPKYRDPDNPANTYGGKGPKPTWLKQAIEDGRELEEFLV